jgi:hypothetical protein
VGSVKRSIIKRERIPTKTIYCNLSSIGHWATILSLRMFTTYEYRQTPRCRGANKNAVMCAKYIILCMYVYILQAMPQSTLLSLECQAQIRPLVSSQILVSTST